MEFELVLTGFEVQRETGRLSFTNMEKVTAVAVGLLHTERLRFGKDELDEQIQMDMELLFHSLNFGMFWIHVHMSGLHQEAMVVVAKKLICWKDFEAELCI